MRAVAMFAYQGHIYFAGAGLEGRQVALNRLKSVITAIGGGEGDDFVRDAMRWVRNVQFRALQDHAAISSFQFDQAWCAKSLCHWSEQWEPWLTSLRTREERDIGWVPGPYTPSCSGEVASLRNDIRRLVDKIAAATRQEDDAHWQCHERGNAEVAQQCLSSRQPEETHLSEESQNPRLGENNADESALQSTDVPPLLVGVASGTSFKIPTHPADIQLTRPVHGAPTHDSPPSDLGNSGTVEPPLSMELSSPMHAAASYAHEEVAAVERGSEGGVTVEGSEPIHSQGAVSSTANVTGPAVKATATTADAVETEGRDTDPEPGEPSGGEADRNNPYTFESPGYDANVQSTYPGAEPRDTTSNTSVEPEYTVTLRSVNAEWVDVHGGQSSEQCPLVTLFPEVEHGVEVKRASPVEEPCMTVTQVMRSVEGVEGVEVVAPMFEGSLSQWINGNSAPVEVTPVNGVSIMCARSPDIVSCDVVFKNCPLNLSEKFEKDGVCEAVEQVISLSLRPEGVQTIAKPNMTSSGQTAKESSETKGPCGPPSGTERHVGEVQFPGLSLEEVYRTLKVDDLLKRVPRGGEGYIRKPETVFFNHCGKEVIVKHKAIRDLKHIKTRLGNDIVDFAMSRLVWAAGENLPAHVHVLSSYVSSTLPAIVDRPDELEKFARKWMTPPAGVDPRSVTDLIIPWVAFDHWSILVLQPRTLLHFDSYKGEFHKPAGIHSDFWCSLSKAWHCLLGEPRQEIEDVVTVEVTQQTGNNECGHLSIRNAMLYLKVSTS